MSSNLLQRALNRHNPVIYGYLVEHLEVEEIVIGPLQLPDTQYPALQACNDEGSAGHIQH